MKHITYILGASDPEMEQIEKHLRAHALSVEYAYNALGERVRPHEAYKARLRPDVLGDVAFVECEVAGRTPVAVFDHHREGDPGFGIPPEQYYVGASLAQILAHLRQEPTPVDLLYMAADHCLGAAYQGRCPGIDPDDLLKFRAEVRGKYLGTDPNDLLRAMRRAMDVVREAPTVELAPGILARDLRGEFIPELPDAQARLGESVLTGPVPAGGILYKYGCMGSEEACRAFLTSFASAQGWGDSYGDPGRGIVGAYGGAP